MQLKVIDFQIKSISEIKHLPTRETILHPFFLYNSVDYVLLMESYRFLKEDVNSMLDKISKVEKLRGVVDGFDAIVEEQQKMYNDCRNEWSNLVKEVDQRVNVLEPILQKVEDMSVFDEFLDLIKVCAKLNEEDENDLSVFLNEYYLPLKKIFFKVFEETKDSQIATIIHFINQLNYVDQKMIKNREHFITASNNLKQQLEKMMPISNLINKNKL